MWSEERSRRQNTASRHASHAACVCSKEVALTALSEVEHSDTADQSEGWHI